MNLTDLYKGLDRLKCDYTVDNSEVVTVKYRPLYQATYLTIATVYKNRQFVFSVTVDIEQHPRADEVLTLLTEFSDTPVEER